MKKRKIAVLFSVIIVAVGLAGCSESEEKEMEQDHQQQEQASKEILYVGTFAGRGGEGLYVYEFERETGGLDQLQTVSDREAPDFQALHPEGTYLYSVSDEAFAEDSDHGTISAYRIDRETGRLSLINEQSAEGRGPAHVSVDPKGRFAYVSNYSGGNLSVFAINPEDGSLSQAVDVVQHEGSSVNEERQNAPHVHSAIPSADGRFLYVSDLGTDRIMIYKVDQNSGELSPAEVPHAESTPGSGPRHFTFHPDNNYAYSAEELSSTVAVFQADSSTGALTQIQRISMLPEAYDEAGNSAADIHTSPDGRFLYASNRGHDSLVIYEIDQDSGKLSLVGHEPTRGGHPRNFMIDRRGTYVLVANMDDDNIVVFERDKETGELNYTGQQIEVPMPVCLTQHIIEK
ncbi:6-phosphogluconolactonase [Fodinibius roseus]|uniref:6-phosphogluconolactonase n=1 Tax=Fodinibius roseus TaxID=1194090 RepID=A0A1M5HXM0_9BACT|nr:lactonase family protein [Fodinibius roseus]SHG20610.1 6-phosphogluconolactonase [Fodinibius roseus]